MRASGDRLARAIRLGKGWAHPKHLERPGSTLYVMCAGRDGTVSKESSESVWAMWASARAQELGVGR